jgi:hypothetical protein
VTRDEKVAKAQMLRDQGVSVHGIADRMGAKYRTVFAWLNDPDLSKQRARRERYGKPCADCGKVTDGSNGRAAAPDYCQDCRRERDHERSCAEIIAAIQRFAKRYGRPPRAPDFSPCDARRLGHDWRAERYYADGDYVATNTVLGVFGSWGAAIEAAGFPRPAVGTYPRKGQPLAQRGAHLADERQAA